MFKYPHTEGPCKSVTKEHCVFKFDNGYGASVIRGFGSYGYQDGLYELAVLGPGGRLVYDTPITDDVLGHLTPDEVNDLLDRIAGLPPRVEQGAV